MFDKFVHKLPVRYSLTLLFLLMTLCALLFAVWNLRRETESGPWNAHRVKPGMTRHQVARIMGERHDVWCDGKLDYWEYLFDLSNKQGSPRVFISFKDHEVVKVYDQTDPAPRGLYRGLWYGDRRWRRRAEAAK
jgi:outer membrane protein assembly factor BamE (lipoprotein component of BamABCDE complex)